MASRKEFDAANVDWEMVNNVLDAFKPTPEDLARQLDDDELVELSRRVKCRVLMWRWNAVEDHARKLRLQGRLQKKTPRQANALLAKAVNRFKATAVYTDAEIDAVRREEWGLRKKENLMRLNVWAEDRREAAKKAQKDKAQNVLNNAILDSKPLSVAADEPSASVPSATAIVPVPSGCSSRLLEPSTSSQVGITAEHNSSASRGDEAPLPSPNAIASCIHGTASPIGTADHGSLPISQEVHMTADFLALSSESLSLSSQSIQQLNTESETPYFVPSGYSDFNERISCLSKQSQAK